MGELSGVVVHVVQVGEGAAVEVVVVVVCTPVVDVGGASTVAPVPGLHAPVWRLLFADGSGDLCRSGGPRVTWASVPGFISSSVVLPHDGINQLGTEMSESHSSSVCGFSSLRGATVGPGVGRRGPDECWLKAL